MAESSLVNIIALALVGGAVALGLVLGAVKQHQRARRRRSFEELTHRLGGTFSMEVVAPSAARGAFQNGGLSCLVDLTRGAQGLPPFLRLRVPIFARRADTTFAATRGAVSSGPVGVSFRRRTLVDRLGQSVSLVRAVSSGDPVFDERVVLDSDAPPEAISVLLRSSDARASLSRLLDTGLLRIDLFVGAPEIVAVRRHPTIEHADAALQVAHELTTVVATLPAFSADPVQRPNALRNVAVPVVATVLASIATFGAFYLPDAVLGSSPPPDLVVFQYASLLWLLMAVATFFLVRQKTHALRNLVATLLVLVPASFGFAYTAWLFLGDRIEIP